MASARQQIDVLQSKIGALLPSVPEEPAMPAHDLRGSYTLASVDERSACITRPQLEGLRDWLRGEIEKKLANNGGFKGELCKGMLVAFFSMHPETLEGVLTE